MVEVITIRRDRYLGLIKQEGKLSALEAAHVNNWSGYDDAMNILREDPPDILSTVEAEDRAAGGGQ